MRTTPRPVEPLKTRAAHLDQCPQSNTKTIAISAGPLLGSCQSSSRPAVQSSCGPVRLCSQNPRPWLPTPRTSLVRPCFPTPIRYSGFYKLLTPRLTDHAAGQQAHAQPATRPDTAVIYRFPPASFQSHSVFRCHHLFLERPVSTNISHVRIPSRLREVLPLPRASW